MALRLPVHAAVGASLKLNQRASALSGDSHRLAKLGGLNKASGNGLRKEFFGSHPMEPAVRPSASTAPPATAAAPVAAPVAQENWDELNKSLEGASPFEIMQKALTMFGNDIAIAFSGAEDVALIEYAHLTGLPYRVFSLETGRLNPETYRLFDEVEKKYNIHIEYMFPDASEVEALVRAKGLFSFYQDGHQECCRVRKVRPLRRALKGLRAWITGQRRDQSPGTRANVPVVQVDPAFEGLDGGPGSLIKFNPLTAATGAEVWNFLRTMNVPINALHSQGYVSIGCEPCTRPVLPGQHEREGRWWWEDATAKECGLHKGNLNEQQTTESGIGAAVEVQDIFTGKNVTALSREEIERATAEPRDKAGLVVLYAPWCQYSQAMDEAFNQVADTLEHSPVLVGKFRADGDQKAYAQQNLQLVTFPTILFFPRGTRAVVKYPSERRDVDSLLAFVKSFQ
ncbi:phosphoadenosine phosphosulfate reductase [Marchantia polymorpha subsp. ruderalis]|uniref:Adenosine 5'-phosphosulfate reductase n=1 Tax=Marchantia polymorpha TaxID=3197 RepID=A0A2R6W4N0_MARPO|nr:hypothetical protein MARPO_0154s0046 [Marchantia polymorpha]BBN20068.1 hypothetical protein Mp_8g16180 [Marchantia polymorpha subsp. ruderalis]|eukprot:PTQ28825.1 hypothetical protein MARPO_0154s0046 [Marchantia polymorpha]